MMGRQTGIRASNPVVTRLLAVLREKLAPFYSEIGRPSVAHRSGAPSTASADQIRACHQRADRQDARHLRACRKPNDKTERTAFLRRPSPAPG